MPRYIVAAHVTISVSGEVEADSLGEAITKATELEMPVLCIQCGARQSDDEWGLGGEIDGAAVNIRVEDGEPYNIRESR